MGSSKAVQVRTHNPIPWPKIHKQYEAGVPMNKMGDHFGYVNPDDKDKYHEIRGICSRGKSPGYRNAEGKVIKFSKPTRDKAMKAAGLTVRGNKIGAKPTPKVAKTKVVKAAWTPKPTKQKNSVAIVQEPDGKFIRVSINSRQALMPVSEFNQAAVEILNGSGFEVTAKPGTEEDNPVVILTPVPEAGGETVQAPEPSPEVVEPTQAPAESEEPESTTEVVAEEIPEPAVA